MGLKQYFIAGPEKREALTRAENTLAEQLKLDPNGKKSPQKRLEFLVK